MLTRVLPYGYIWHHMCIIVSMVSTPPPAPFPSAEGLGLPASHPGVSTLSFTSLAVLQPARGLLPCKPFPGYRTETTGCDCWLCAQRTMRCVYAQPYAALTVSLGDLGQVSWLSRFQFLFLNNEGEGTSLTVQGLRLWTSTERDMGSIPGQGTKTPHATWWGQKTFFN